MENQILMPEIYIEDCTGCGDCVPACPAEAISVVKSKVTVAPDVECSYCDACEDVCATGAIDWPYEVVFAEENSI